MVPREWPDAAEAPVGLAPVDFFRFPVVIRPWGRREDLYRWPYFYSSSRCRRRASSVLAKGYATVADHILETTIARGTDRDGRVGRRSLSDGSRREVPERPCPSVLVPGVRRIAHHLAAPEPSTSRRSGARSRSRPGTVGAGMPPHAGSSASSRSSDSIPCRCRRWATLIDAGTAVGRPRMSRRSEVGRYAVRAGRRWPRRARRDPVKVERLVVEGGAATALSPERACGGVSTQPISSCSRQAASDTPILDDPGPRATGRCRRSRPDRHRTAVARMAVQGDRDAVRGAARRLHPLHTFRLLELPAEIDVEGAGRDLVGVMIKIADSNAGAVSAAGVEKRLSETDRPRLDEGVELCHAILLRLGVEHGKDVPRHAQRVPSGRNRSATEAKIRTIHPSDCPRTCTSRM